MRGLFLLMMLATANACWFQSRKSSVEHLISFAKKQHVDVDTGITESDLVKVMNLIPSSLSWAVGKSGGAASIMKRCDLNGDGVIHAEELWKESECLNSCWKQVAISTFL